MIFSLSNSQKKGCWSQVFGPSSPTFCHTGMSKVSIALSCPVEFFKIIFEVSVLLYRVLDQQNYICPLPCVGVGCTAPNTDTQTLKFFLGPRCWLGLFWRSQRLGPDFRHTSNFFVRGHPHKFLRKKMLNMKKVSELHDFDGTVLKYPL